MIGLSGNTKLRISREAPIIHADYLTRYGLVDTPFTGETMTVGHTFFDSKNINITRQKKNQRISGKTISGGIKFHLSPLIYDDLIEGVFWSNWATYSVGEALLTISLSTINNTITDTNSSNAFRGLIDGQYIYVRTGGTISNENCKIYKISEKTNDNLLTLDASTPIELIENSVTAQISASIIRLPETIEDIERHSYFIEKQHIDLTPSQFLSFTTNYVNKMTLNCTTQALVSGSFDFIGKSASLYNDGAYDAIDNPNGNGIGSMATINSNELIDSPDIELFGTATDITAIYINGNRINDGSDDTPWVQGVDFSISNNFKGINAVSEMEIIGVSPNRMTISGTMAIYFSNADMYEALMNESELSLAYVVENTNKNAYVFSFPRIKLTDSSLGYQDAGMINNIQWVALYDSNTKTSIQIDRLLNTSMYETPSLNMTIITSGVYNLITNDGYLITES